MKNGNITRLTEALTTALNDNEKLTELADILWYDEDALRDDLAALLHEVKSDLT